MSDDVPRRLPRTQGQRVQNVARTHAAQSLGGATAAARPVASATPTPRIYQPPTSGSNVVTDEAKGESSIAISSTASGPGEVYAHGSNAVAVGHVAQAQAGASVALGNFAEVTSDGTVGVAIGQNARASAPGAVAVGSGGTTATWAAGASSVALGAGALAGGAYSVAIGQGAHAENDNEIALGHGSQFVIIKGALCLADSSLNLWRLVVSTSGALSTVAYP